MPRPSNQCFQFDVGAGFIPPSALEVGGSGGGGGSLTLISPPLFTLANAAKKYVQTLLAQWWQQASGTQCVDCGTSQLTRYDRFSTLAALKLPCVNGHGHEPTAPSGTSDRHTLFRG